MKNRPALRGTQRGSVLLFALITLTILLIGAVALVRSFNNSLFTAGNVAFKRDLLNQAERAVPVALAAMQTGAMASSTLRANHSVDNNYRASVLPTNNLGIPDALLLNDTDFATYGSTSKDITVADQAVTVRYLIDRLCMTTGLDTALGASKCTLADSGAPSGSSASEVVRAEDASAGGAGALPLQVVYRLSIRVTGPRNTQAFFQTTFSL